MELPRYCEPGSQTAPLCVLAVAAQFRLPGPVGAVVDLLDPACSQRPDVRRRPKRRAASYQELGVSLGGL